MGQTLPRLILWAIAAFYAYGAYGHIANIAGMRGYTWAEAPLKWQLFDIIYLALDIIVIVGFLLRWRIGVIAFFAVAVSQVALYTVLRSWVVDVPVKFAPTPAHLSYLDLMVGLQLGAIVLVLVALRMGALKRDVSEG